MARADALRRDVVTQAQRLEHVARMSIGRGLGKVIENQKALEAEARQFKAVALGLQSEAARWEGVFSSFCTEVEVRHVPGCMPTALSYHGCG